MWKSVQSAKSADKWFRSVPNLRLLQNLLQHLQCELDAGPVHVLVGHHPDPICADGERLDSLLAELQDQAGRIQVLPLENQRDPLNGLVYS